MSHVKADIPFKTEQDVIEYAKKNPCKLRFTGTTAASPDEVIITL